MLRDVMFGNRRYFRELLAGSEEGIELRASHLGAAPPRHSGPSVNERLADAYAEAN
jgi:hypothetical protein